MAGFHKISDCAREPAPSTIPVMLLLPVSTRQFRFIDPDLPSKKKEPNPVVSTVFVVTIYNSASITAILTLLPLREKPPQLVLAVEEETTTCPPFVPDTKVISPVKFFPLIVP